MSPDLASPLANCLDVQALLVALPVIAQVAAGEELGDEIDALGLGVLPTPVAADDVGVVLRGENNHFVISARESPINRFLADEMFLFTIFDSGCYIWIRIMRSQCWCLFSDAPW